MAQTGKKDICQEAHLLCTGTLYFRSDDLKRGTVNVWGSYIVYPRVFDWFVDVRYVLKAWLPPTLFREKAKELYALQLDQTGEAVQKEDQLRFSSQWVKGWMHKYQVSLKHVNKRFALPMAVCWEQILELIQNVMRVWVWFEKVLGTDINISNLDQILLHCNESSTQSTFTFKDQETYVKNYMLPWDMVNNLNPV